MKKLRSLVLTALGLLAFSPAAAYAETGRIVGHFDGAAFDLHIGAQNQTSGVDFDFFQQSGSTYLEVDVMALEEAGAGYEGLLLFLQFEATGGANRDQMDVAHLVGAEIIIVGDWPLNAPDPLRGWVAEFDGSGEAEVAIQDGNLALTSQFSSDRFCLYEDMDSFDPTPVSEGGVPVCTSGEVALQLGATSDRPEPASTTENVEVLGQITGMIGDENYTWLTIQPVGGAGAATATAEVDNGKLVSLRAQGHSPTSENFISRDVLSIELSGWPALEVGQANTAEVSFFLDSTRNFYTSDVGGGRTTATIGSLEMNGDYGQVQFDVEGILCRAENFEPVLGDCLPFAADVTTEVRREAR